VITDALAHVQWSSQLELMEHMTEGWREFLGRPGSFHGEGGGVMSALPVHKYQHPEGDYLSDSWPEPGGPPGSDPATLLAQTQGRVVLSPQSGILVPSIPNHYLAVEVARAANDWLAARWLGADERLFGLVVVPNQLPEEAAAEIRRAGANPRMVGVLMGGNGLNKPFGHPAYHPIYAAAAELDLAVVIHGGGDATPEVITHTAAGGLPATWVEYRVLRAQPVITHLVSLIGQGVFEKFPGLRVLIAGIGVQWLPSIFWRFDVNWKSFRREAPWVTEAPSAYLRSHVRVGTWPLDRGPNPAAFRRHLDAFGGVGDLLCFASGYPERESDSLAAVESVIPAEWRQRVVESNSQWLYRWPGTSRDVPGPKAQVGTMEVR